jgi:hypothetical protein
MCGITPEVVIGYPPWVRAWELLTGRGWDFTPQAEAVRERAGLCAAA